MLDPIKRKFDQLSPDLQKEVADFIDFLAQKRATKRKKRFELNWIGGLKEYKNQFTSLELQKKALQWRD